MSTESYGSFRVEFLHSEDGEILKENSLFFNLQDLWTINQSGFLLGTYKTKVVKLKKIVRRELKRKKELPGFKTFLQKIKEEDEIFDPVNYLDGDHEQYFTKLQVWKETYEKEYLERYPNLREQIRHQKINSKPSWVKHYR